MNSIIVAFLSFIIVFIMVFIKKELSKRYKKNKNTIELINLCIIILIAVSVGFLYFVFKDNSTAIIEAVILGFVYWGFGEDIEHHKKNDPKNNFK